MSGAIDSFSPDACYSARFDPSSAPTNVDADGIAVSVANIIVHLCLRVLITWSPQDVDDGVQAILLQICPILLSTLFSINHNQLSLFDASFALTLTSSPLTVYMVFASTCDWFGIETRLYKCIDKSRRLTIRTIGTSVLFLWFGLSVTLRLSDRAFINSRICQGSTFKNWLKDFSGFVLGVATDPGVQSIPCGSLLVCNLGTLVFLKGHLMAIREAQGNLERPPSLLRLSISWTIIRQSWHTLINCEWYTYLLFAYLDASWVYNVISNTASASQGYVLSYGQVLSLFAVVPPVISTVKLVYVRRLDLLHFLLSLPRLCVVGVARFVPFPKQALYAQDNPTPSSPGFTLQEVSREAPPEESQQLGGPTFNPPDSQAHPGSQWDRPLPRCDQSPTSLIEDVHLANIIPANRHDTTTTAKSTEPTCDVRRPCPPITESVMQVMTEEVSPVCEPQRDVVVNDLSQSSASTNVTSTNSAFPTARRAWTYG